MTQPFLSSDRGSTLAAATASVCVRRIAVGCAGTSESRHGESNSPEQITGGVIACACAFLIRHAVIGSLNEELCGSDDPDHREDAEGYVYSRTRSRGRKLTVEYAVDCVGELVALTGTATATAALLDLGAEDDGLNSLNNGGGIVVAHGVEIADAAIVVIGTGGIGGDSAFAAVENDVLYVLWQLVIRRVQ